MARKKNTKKKDTQKFPSWVAGILFLGWGFALILSLLSFRPDQPSNNWLGLFGHVLAYFFEYLFGVAAFLIPCFFFAVGYYFILNRPIPHARWTLFSFLFFFLSLTMLLSWIASVFPHFSHAFNGFIYTHSLQTNSNPFSAIDQTFLGGVPFFHLYAHANFFNFSKYVGTFGSLLLFIGVGTLSFLSLMRIPPKQFIIIALKAGNKGFTKFIQYGKALFSSKPSPQKATAASVNKRIPFKEEAQFERPLLSRSIVSNPEKDSSLSPIKYAEPIAQKTRPKPPSPSFIQGDLSIYQLPPSSLLTEIAKPNLTALKTDLRKHAEVLEETLLSFGIEAKVGDIHLGPTITLFEVHPAIGVKVQKIKALERDIALNMQAKSIRILAPIPGKAAIGIEVPNPYPQEVSFRQMLEGYEQKGRKLQIPLLLGKLVGGEDVWSDLSKMPHLIIAGATGSGKSVCINTIVMSIVMNAKPDEIKLVMVDPKKVELTAYSPLPHMLAPVITEPHGAKQALSWLVKEMQKRYELFRQLSIRNIIAFNTRKPNKEKETSLSIEVPPKLPYIVVIIDELADLMMVSASDIETPIARIAQMARAVGIHMILATQRPSREVITGLIKANFPCRIAFKVASRVNSQIIIDEVGAESLLGNGDMLFLPPGTSTLQRSQGAFIRDEDIHRVIDFVTTQAPANYLIPSFDDYRDDLDTLSSLSSDEEGQDALYSQAKSLVLETGTASTTFLQRKLKIGYARAASLMDELEGRGIIGPQEGSKPRKVFYSQPVKEEEFEDE